MLRVLIYAKYIHIKSLVIFMIKKAHLITNFNDPVRKILFDNNKIWFYVCIMNWIKRKAWLPTKICTPYKLKGKLICEWVPMDPLIIWRIIIFIMIIRHTGVSSHKCNTMTTTKTWWTCISLSFECLFGWCRLCFQNLNCIFFLVQQRKIAF